MEAAVPPDRTCGSTSCWRAKRTRFKYASKDGVPAGIRAVTLRVGARPGQASILVEGRGPRLLLPTLPLREEPKVTVQLRNSAGACWGADYSTATRNDATRFKAKSD
jgi:hypothetical protein